MPLTPDSPLPHYDQPPVSEVVLSIQFQPVPGLTPVHLGSWWSADDRRDRYPICEVRPPLPPMIEEFDAPSRVPAFELTVGPPPGAEFGGAIWLLKKDRTELLQVQNDRFTRNWTAGPAHEPYPRYARLQPEFRAEFEAFRTFLSESGFRSPQITQCELTYINPIRPSEVWERHGQLDRILAPWSGRYSEGFLPEAEDLQVLGRYVIEHGDVPAGRLTMSMQSARDPQGSPVYLLTLVARGAPLGPDVDGAMAFLDLGHDWIVKAFTTLTTEAMHEHWKRAR
jgi:uncharacterized protein (TIGR04255 family)